MCRKNPSTWSAEDEDSLNFEDCNKILLTYERLKYFFAVLCIERITMSSFFMTKIVTRPEETLVVTVNFSTLKFSGKRSLTGFCPLERLGFSITHIRSWSLFDLFSTCVSRRPQSSDSCTRSWQLCTTWDHNRWCNWRGIWQDSKVAWSWFEEEWGPSCRGSSSRRWCQLHQI